METAIVGIIGAFIGILLTNALRIVLDLRNRRERMRDIQTALRAEIRSHRKSLEYFVDEPRWRSTIAQIGTEKGFSPFVPREVEPFVFDSIVRDIHVLPGDVIDPVILYYRQWRAISAFVEDMRSAKYAELEPARRASMYEDYAAMCIFATDLAKDAVDAINRSLRQDREA